MFLSCVFLCNFLSAAVHPLAEQAAPSVDDIRTFLQSEHPADRAWAAFKTAPEQMDSLRPEIVAALASALEADGTDEDPTIPYLCDALIRDNNSRIEAPLLEELGRQQSTCAMILAARDVAQHQAFLLSKVHGNEQRHNHWIAAVNLLVAAGDEEIFARLFAALPLELWISVVPPDDDTRHGGGRRRAIGRGDGHLRQREGFPPPVHYTLTNQSDDATVLCEGPMNIYARRWLGEGAVTIAATHADRQRYAIDIAARALATEQLPLSDRRSRSIRVSQASELLPAINRELHDYRQSYRATLDLLVAHGWLSAETASSLEASIAVRIFDHHPELNIDRDEFPAHWQLDSQADKQD